MSNQNFTSLKYLNVESLENSAHSLLFFTRYTSVSSEKKLNSAFAECKDVILIFSVQTSGHFQVLLPFYFQDTGYFLLFRICHLTRILEDSDFLMYKISMMLNNKHVDKHKS